MIINKTFKADKFLWICTHNQDYAQRRTMPGNEGFGDLNECATDAQNFRKGAKGFGATMSNIREMADLEFSDF